MPSNGKIDRKYDDNGWHHVIRQNGLSKVRYIFTTSHEGRKASITIQNLKKPNDNENSKKMKNLSAACDYVLKCHKWVRDVEHESGGMSMIGWRKDVYKGIIRKFRPRQSKNKKLTNIYSKRISEALTKEFNGTSHEVKLKKAIKDNNLGGKEFNSVTSLYHIVSYCFAHISFNR